MAEVDPFSGYVPAARRAPQSTAPEVDPFSGYTPQGAPAPSPAPTPAPSPSWGFREYATEGARSIINGLGKAGAGLTGLPADAARLIGAGSDFIQSKATGVPQDEIRANAASRAILSPEMLAHYGSEALQADLPTRYEPQTRGGKFLSEAVNFGAQAAALPLGGGGLLARTISQGVVPGLASEAAGQLTEGTAVEPYARLAGALGGGVGAGVVQARRGGAAARTANDEFQSAIPAAERAGVLARADEIMADAGKFGTQVSYLNALDRASDGRLNLSLMQADAEGMGRLRAFNAATPELNKAASGRVFDAVAPAPADANTVGPAVGRAAESVVQDANTARTRAVSADASAAKLDSVDPSEIAAIVERLDAQIAADKTGLTHAPLGQLRNSLVAREARDAVPAVPGERVPVNDPKTGRLVRYETQPGTPEVPAAPREYVQDVENLDRARKYFRDQTELPAFAPNALDRETGATVGRATGEIDAALTAGSPAYARRNAEYARISRETVEPLMQGPIGRLADRDITTKAATEALFPSAPDAQTASQVRSAVSAVSEKNPLAAEQLVRAHLERNYKEATQDLMGGANENGGAKWAAAMTGNDAQAENLYAGLRGLRDGDVRADGVRRFIEVLKAQGERQGQGSNTANKLQRREMREAGGGVVGRAVDIAATWNLPSRFKTYAKEIMDGRHLDQIAAMATNPKSIAAFRGILRAEDPSGAVGRLLTIAKNSPPGALQLRVQPRSEDR